MVNHPYLKKGARIVYVRDDPVRGDYAIPPYCRNEAGTVTSKQSYRPHERDNITSYNVRFDRGDHWFVLSTMIDLEEGPW